ncbi:hypothetical protein GXW74_14115 [Roseomonas eburnea]|uniref:Uncharacterized protein n=1 Tax=Neoroseomonas eburnea TaxID=1346889 RepID=A0A9X9XD42_9PROT|nr:DUF6790 family protein [Neoroseomonas eburnea]MBR0681628.1 hypothetical protein [Neoroseomonas eburnea]
MADLIRLVLSHLPIILLVAALLIAALRRDGQPAARRLLDWLLLLAVGVETLWAGLFHIFAPHVAAASIGWQVSPFQFEVGVADAAIGVVAIAAFRRSLAFKSAVVAYISLFYAGVAAGHVIQAAQAHDFAPNNFGLLLLMTIVKALALPLLLWRAWTWETRRA